MHKPKIIELRNAMHANALLSSKNAMIQTRNKSKYNQAQAGVQKVQSLVCKLTISKLCKYNGDSTSMRRD